MTRIHITDATVAEYDAKCNNTISMVGMVIHENSFSDYFALHWWYYITNDAM